MTNEQARRAELLARFYELQKAIDRTPKNARTTLRRLEEQKKELVAEIEQYKLL